jgi:hypothetical protein
MRRFIDWLKSQYYRVVPARLPTVASAVKIYDDNTPTSKVSAMWKATCGLIVAGYHNVTRRNSWLVRIDNNGTASKVYEGKRETIGTPDLVGGNWVIPSEGGDESSTPRALLMDDKSGKISHGKEQPEKYSTRCLAGMFGVNYKGANVRLWDALRGATLATWPMDMLEGIVSGLAYYGDDVLLAVMDGSKPGIAAWKAKWVCRGSYPEVAVFQGRILGFAKSGDVHEIDGKSGKVIKTLTSVGNKWQRVRIRGGVLYGTTCNRDQVWCYNGKNWKLLKEWADEPADSTKSGSLFNTTLDFWGNDLCVARSIDNRGFEVWRLVLK